MKKTISVFLFITLFNGSFSQPYKEQLKKVNDFLKTFDNGYYGYLEVKDGYLYDRFASGKYSKSEIKYLGKAYESEPGKKVSINCIDGKACVFSTYTDSYHESIGFSQTYSFKTSELIKLLDNLIAAYKKTNDINTDNKDDDLDYDAEKRKLESLKSNIDITSNSSVNKTNMSGNYQSALEKLNSFLKSTTTYSDSWFEVKNGYIIEHFKKTYTSKAKISDIEGVEKDGRYNVVHLYCKNKSTCVYSDYMKSDYDYFNFNCSSATEMNTLFSLMTEFWNQLNGKKSSVANNDSDDWIDEDFDELAKVAPKINSTSNTTSSGNYQTALKKLNDYLKTFDNGYYGYFEVKDGYLYDRFKDGKNYCKAKLIDLGKAFEQETSRKVELPCKGSDNCLYSTFTNQYYNSFSFSQSTDFNSAELITLLNNLVIALNNKSTTTQTKTETNPVTSSNNAAYSAALKKLNDYLKTFDNGYYGYFEVKDGYIYDRFKAGKYNKFKMEDMEGAVIQTQYNRVIFKCKGDNKCISTDWKENGKEEYTQFINGSSYNFQELATLLNNFRDAYLSMKPSASNNSTLSNNKSREQQAKERQQTENVKTKNKSNDDDLDEDWDALEKEAVKLNNSTKEVKESTGTLRAILYDKEIILTDIDNSDPNFDKAKKYIGKKGKTKTYIIPNDDNLTFYGDIYFDGILFKFKKIRIKEVTANENTSSTSSNNNYSEPLKKLNEYLKIFNPETYDRVEVKDSKVYFYFKVYTKVYNSSISISDLVQNTTTLNAAAIGEFGSKEVKIFCKGDTKCFYSTYSNGYTDHFRFFSNTVKDLTKMEQLVKEFIKAL